MDDKDQGVLSDAEITEQENVANVKEDNLRSMIIKDLGLTEDDTNKALIEKIVSREKGLRSGHGKLLGKYKAIRGTQSTSVTPKNEPKGDFDPEKFRNETEAALKTRFDEEFLEDSDYSDTLRAEIRKIAKLNNVSARAATKDPYIKHLLDAETTAKRAAEAANNGDGAGRGGQGGDGKMPEKFMDPKFMITEQGRKEYAEWEASKKK